MTLRSGDKVGVGGRFEIRQPLGKGGFGHTYLATDTHDGSKCAVKCFSFSSNNPEELKKAQELFEREAKILRDLTQSSENKLIPKYIHFFEEDQKLYLVQEYIKGLTIKEEIRQKGQLNEDDVVDLLEDVLESLKFIHIHNMIHRDIKPDNLIRRDEDERIVVIDFGAVKEKVTQLVATPGTKIYSQGYTPIEQIHGNAKHCSDIYALGIVAFECLTGIKPDQNTKDANGQVVWPIQVSPGLVKIIETMTEESWRNRYQSADEVLRAIENFKKTQVVVPPSRPQTSAPSVIVPILPRLLPRPVLVGSVLLVGSLAFAVPLALRELGQSPIGPNPASPEVKRSVVPNPASPEVKRSVVPTPASPEVPPSVVPTPASPTPINPPNNIPKPNSSEPPIFPEPPEQLFNNESTTDRNTTKTPNQSSPKSNDEMFPQPPQ